MNKKLHLYIDQYGNKFYALSVRELRKKIANGSSRVSKMYRDKIDGTSVHVGYTIGNHWLTAFVPMEIMG